MGGTRGVRGLVVDGTGVGGLERIQYSMLTILYRALLNP